MRETERQSFIRHIGFWGLYLFPLTYFFKFDFIILLTSIGFPDSTYLKHYKYSFSIYRFIGGILLFLLLVVLSFFTLGEKKTVKLRHKILLIGIGIFMLLAFTFFHAYGLAWGLETGE